MLAKLRSHRFSLPYLLLGVLAIQLLLPCSVQEDAFISFRYARNLVEGNGLVYNPGERVEGYTNFLWTMIVAGGMAVSLDPVDLSQNLGIVVTLLLVLVVFVQASRFDRPRHVTGGLVAALIVAASPSVLIEGIQGLESNLFALLVTTGVLAGVSARVNVLDAGGVLPFRLLGSAVLLAMAAMTRPEGVGVFFLLTGAAAVLHCRRRTWRSLRWEAGAVCLFTGLYLPYWLWRFSYYGWPFPNTFYAKTGGGVHHVLKGLAYEARFLAHNPVVALLTFWLAWVWIAEAVERLKQRRLAAPASPVPPASGAPGGLQRYVSVRHLLGGVVVGYLVYVILVGGDFKATNRFIIPVLPLWALLLDASVSRYGWPVPGAATPLIRRLTRNTSARASESFFRTIVVVALIATTAAASPFYLRWVHKRAWDLQRRTACGRWLSENAPPGSVLAIHSAGIIPYYSGLQTIDMWGLSDLHIAHKRTPEMGRGLVGHEKGDVRYVFSQKPTYYVAEKRFFTNRKGHADSQGQAVLEPDLQPFLLDYLPVSIPVEMGDRNDGHTYWFNFYVRDE